MSEHNGPKDIYFSMFDESGQTRVFNILAAHRMAKKHKPKVAAVDMLIRAIDGGEIVEDRVATANLDNPIYMAVLEDGLPYVIDGLHRITRAHREGVVDLPVIVFPWEDARQLLVDTDTFRVLQDFTHQTDQEAEEYQKLVDFAEQSTSLLFLKMGSRTEEAFMQKIHKQFSATHTVKAIPAKEVDGEGRTVTKWCLMLNPPFTSEEIFKASKIARSEGIKFTVDENKSRML